MGAKRVTFGSAREREREKEEEEFQTNTRKDGSHLTDLWERYHDITAAPALTSTQSRGAHPPETSKPFNSYYNPLIQKKEEERRRRRRKEVQWNGDGSNTDERLRRPGRRTAFLFVSRQLRRPHVSSK